MPDLVACNTFKQVFRSRSPIAKVSAFSHFVWHRPSFAALIAFTTALMAAGSKIAKIALPIVLVALTALVGFTVFKSTSSTAPSTSPSAVPIAAAPIAAVPPAPVTAPVTPTASTAPTATTATAPAQTPVTGAAQSTPAGPVVPIPGLAPRTWPAYSPLTIGQLQPPATGSTGGSARVATPPGYEMQLEFTPLGAGIAKLQSARLFDSIQKSKQHEVLQKMLVRSVAYSDGTSRGYKLVPMAILGVTVNGVYISLTGTLEEPIWQQSGPGQFFAILADDQGKDTVKLTRTYELVQGTYSVRVLQEAINLSKLPINLAWRQAGAMDIPNAVIGYGGDVRRLRIGTIPGPAASPDGQFVDGATFTPHDTVVGKPLDGLGLQWTDPPIYPTARSIERGEKLAWVALANRYFASAVYSLSDRQPKRPDGKPDKELKLAATVERVALSRDEDPYGASIIGNESEMTKNAALVTVLQGAVGTIAPGASADYSVGLYAGPVSTNAITGDKSAESAGLEGLVLYSFGGPCVVCTFQSLTYTLRWYLGILHDYVLKDWALAVIFLVLTVRTILHPVTKWSQSNLQRFGKQMQKLAPKQAALKEKYGDDPKRLREETARLMQEEKINYLQALGCLPMFLQMPVWIALYAMIYFTYELRHEGGFFGVFQAISGGRWGFLGDLAEPDRFISLGFSFPIPLLSGLIGRIDAINFLPLLLGVVFYFQQKYLSPPQATTMSPEMETQQKITKVMMVILFPLMMYNAPAALSLYFVANSTLGIIESRHIRKHVEREDKFREEQEKLLGPAAKRKLLEQPKKGFFARIQDELQRRMAAAEQLRKPREKAERQARK